MTAEATPQTTSLEINLSIGTVSRFENVAAMWRSDMAPRIHTIDQFKEFEKEVKFFEELRDKSIQAAIKGLPFEISITSDHGKSVTIRSGDKEATIAWNGCGILLARVFTPDLLHPLEETKREAEQGLAIAEALHQGRPVKLQFR